MYSRSDPDWFHAYGFRLAPIHPGAANGNYQSNDNYTSRGGGLVRIHAAEMSIAGQIFADAGAPTVTGTLFGGASGGGIWLTADSFDFANTAVLSAKGGNSSYDSPGGGGRIAIGEGMLSENIATLAETGECRGLKASGRRTNEKAFAKFGSKHQGVIIIIKSGNDKNGATVDGDDGSFDYYSPTGNMLIFR